MADRDDQYTQFGVWNVAYRLIIAHAIAPKIAELCAQRAASLTRVMQRRQYAPVIAPP